MIAQAELASVVLSPGPQGAVLPNGQGVFSQGTLAELHASDGEQRLHLAQTVSRLFLRGKQS